ncbi:cupin domain-containing protein [Actibacterium pelagium]|uniref:Cupin n=1 Tax=Actibacterium pelagium TaxID=2029103 RepID=A0A917AFP4_9RHOB|nr:cupin domain-containing protein [Actibacterium pelagium]GGE47452.1 cupin [Actibacterium pelagium]
MTEKFVLKRTEIDAAEGLSKTHFLNSNARRINKSLGDMVGLTGIGVHIIEVPPGCESTEYHRHYHEDECTYVLSGTGEVILDGQTVVIGPGDFIGYPKGGPAHTMKNTGTEVLRCLVVGERLAQDVADYPNKGKRIYRNAGMPWDLVDLDQIDNPVAGAKK